MRAPLEQRSVWPGLAGLTLSLLAALVVEAVGARLLGPGGLFPNMVLIALFIWSIRRPLFLNPFVILVTGVAHELFSGAPLGVWGLSYLLAFALVRDREADGMGADFGPMLARFAALTGIATAGAWAAGSVSTGAPAPLGGLIVEGILTIVVFAVIGWMFARRRERSAFY